MISARNRLWVLHRAKEITNCWYQVLVDGSAVRGTKTDVRASPVLPHAVEKVVVVDNVG